MVYAHVMFVEDDFPACRLLPSNDRCQQTTCMTLRNAPQFNPDDAMDT